MRLQCPLLPVIFESLDRSALLNLAEHPSSATGKYLKDTNTSLRRFGDSLSSSVKSWKNIQNFNDKTCTIQPRDRLARQLRERTALCLELAPCI